ncbi:MAG: hypothetical protein JAY75_16260 [Candidatus Thiodiazotropha taylori]|nr:hypothetical protein [Candidatus Thiodiazotropha taylori]MCW4309771.1 hypothetical protein [Candidatus Thiodiazotropha endolucinida]
MIYLDQKALMWNNVKRLTEIKENGINLFAFIQGRRQVLECKKELTFCRSPLPETVLLVGQNVVMV